jgi:hypothetical protein
MPDHLSTLAPFPPPLPLEDGYQRHAPGAEALRRALLRIASLRNWAGASWPEFIAALLALGRTDIPLSRLAEGHLDALRILDQADRQPQPEALYGVWASRSQRTGVAATWNGDGLLLDGTIRFASGAGLLDRALVPVWLDAETHLLLDLAVSELPLDTSHWTTAAMEVSQSHTAAINCMRVDPIVQVGPVNFYLSRPGFFPGGVGVAACWAGGAARVADLLFARMIDPPPSMLLRLGRVRAQLAAAGAAVTTAAHRLTTVLAGPEKDLTMIQAVSTEARVVVADAVHTVLQEAQRVAGPAGLAYDEDLTRAVHDLSLYVLQQNADADHTFLGALDITS